MEAVPLTTYIMLCTRFGVEHSYKVVGVPIPRLAPQVKCIRVATPFLCPFRFACLNMITNQNDKFMKHTE